METSAKSGVNVEQVWSVKNNVDTSLSKLCLIFCQIITG